MVNPYGELDKRILGEVYGSKETMDARANSGVKAGSPRASATAKRTTLGIK